ncbi:uncharacterized protein LOC111076444 [Drosophila obscura]|uniref:uncharacterized protein LOC111076444 n=1 Tax=Drosophila obscura TaxID=7282 RepID=UPI001BB113F7|nr:uncharacterized protein LOC111076444 [Drosophila obscura]XP_022225941.2 uncharacterized protein LOC111076444 [Drosophila obscura]XP_022225942.2 uncharacterized protein LOC111076444 [Drosophila obscura]
MAFIARQNQKGEVVDRKQLLGRRTRDLSDSEESTAGLTNRTLVPLVADADTDTDTSSCTLVGNREDVGEFLDTDTETETMASFCRKLEELEDAMAGLSLEDGNKSGSQEDWRSETGTLVPAASIGDCSDISESTLIKGGTSPTDSLKSYHSCRTYVINTETPEDTELLDDRSEDRELTTSSSCTLDTARESLCTGGDAYASDLEASEGGTNRPALFSWFKELERKKDCGRKQLPQRRLDVFKRKFGYSKPSISVRIKARRSARRSRQKETPEDSEEEMLQLCKVLSECRARVEKCPDQGLVSSRVEKSKECDSSKDPPADAREETPEELLEDRSADRELMISSSCTLDIGRESLLKSLSTGDDKYASDLEASEGGSNFPPSLNLREFRLGSFRRFKELEQKKDCGRKQLQQRRLHGFKRKFGYPKPSISFRIKARRSVRRSRQKKTPEDSEEELLQLCKVLSECRASVEKCPDQGLVSSRVEKSKECDSSKDAREETQEERLEDRSEDRELMTSGSCTLDTANESLCTGGDTYASDLKAPEGGTNRPALFRWFKELECKKDCGRKQLPQRRLDVFKRKFGYSKPSISVRIKARRNARRSRQKETPEDSEEELLQLCKVLSECRASVEKCPDQGLVSSRVEKSKTFIFSKECDTNKDPPADARED